MSKILKQSDLKKEIAVVVGTRPGIIKFSPVIRQLAKEKLPFFVIHTGQHYSYNMDKQFFDDLELPQPRFTNDKVRQEKLHGAQTAEMIRGIEAALVEAKPAVVIVGGDANTNLAGALATRKLGIKLAHMEAGLRSHDWRMPEEHNRVIIDHISEILLPPTPQAVTNLKEDNVKGEIHMVGNPIVDAVFQNVKIAHQKSKILQTRNLEKEGFLLLTVHREENVDNEEILTAIFENISKLADISDKEIIFPIHPRTKIRLEKYSLWEKVTAIDKLRIIDPVGYLDFLLLIENASLILTDSGGIQEEACIMRTPCITLRDNTERPETVEVGANKIVGADMELLKEAIGYFKDLERNWENPFGDGTTAAKIAAILKRHALETSV